MEIPEFGIVEEELPLKSQAGVKKTPLSENYALLQQHHREKVRLAGEREKLQRGEDKILALLGTEIFVWGKYLEEIQGKMATAGLQEEWRGLVIQQEKMVEELKRQGMELINLTGEPLTPELRNQVSKVFWNPEPEEGLAEPRVKETKEPMIYRRQRLVQGGVVVGARPPGTQQQE